MEKNWTEINGRGVNQQSANGFQHENIDLKKQRIRLSKIDSQHSVDFKWSILEQQLLAPTGWTQILSPRQKISEFHSKKLNNE